MLRHTQKWMVPMFLISASCGGRTADPIYGLRLGATPSQARGRFDPGAPGAFRSESMPEDFALVWEPDGESPVRSARLEFHLGQLVALRVHAAPGAPHTEGPEILTTDTSVLTREATPGQVELTWLARACPTHAVEVMRRIAAHR